MLLALVPAAVSCVNAGTAAEDAASRAYDREAAALRTLHRLGAPLLPGTDLGMYLVYPGSSMHEELGCSRATAG